MADEEDPRLVPEVPVIDVGPGADCFPPSHGLSPSIRWRRGTGLSFSAEKVVGPSSVMLTCWLLIVWCREISGTQVTLPPCARIPARSSLDDSD